MNVQLVFIHGRSQQNKNADTLKSEWIQALKDGLAKSGLHLPIPESQIRFPYYGDTLYGLAAGHSPSEVAQIVVRGAEEDAIEAAFFASVLTEIAAAKGITDAEIDEEAGEQIRERGPLNWKWVQAILTRLDSHEAGSGTAVALATKDVYNYLNNDVTRNMIDTGVLAAMSAGVPTVVIGHSLGSVVAYSILRHRGEQLGWKVPLFVTVGSPLGVTEIRKKFAPLRFPACAKHWYNAMDDRDVVALYPLDANRFDVDPAIENNVNVDNPTSNRHGISGYLGDRTIAAKIHAGLMAAAE